MFHSPIKSFFGVDCLKNNSEILKVFGNNILLITGKNSAKSCGALTEVVSVINQTGKKYVHFDQVTENPDLEIIRKGSDFLKKNNCDVIIAIGGGSPIDAAKAIAATAANNLIPEDLYKPNNIKKGIPIIAIPTTSGTGTEVTQYSVLTNLTTGNKAGFASPFNFPVCSFSDPKFTLSLPQTVTRDTAIDALSHLLEGIYSVKTEPLLYPIIFEGIKLIYENLQECLDQPLNIQIREKLMQAAFYGGLVIAQTGTTLQHSIGYPLTTEYGITHGCSNGIVMKDIMELFYFARKNEIDNLFTYMGIQRQDFYNWLISLNLVNDNFIDNNLLEAHIKKVAASSNIANNPIQVSTESIRKIYEKYIK
ncbi:MAG: iron-containing alcohol dehydrogenase [Candidatus Cloacimonetes bacterium]|nr:iron-containing alcohol dehydrogenase [Candidatus Cloacimonadota bacterium]